MANNHTLFLFHCFDLHKSQNWQFNTKVYSPICSIHHLLLTRDYRNHDCRNPYFCKSCRLKKSRCCVVGSVFVYKSVRMIAEQFVVVILVGFLYFNKVFSFVYEQIAKEGDTFPVPMPVARLSELVKSMMDDDAHDNEDSNGATEIPLPNVKAVVLKKVIEFCEHHLEEPMSDIEKPLTSAAMGDVVQSWYAEFVNLEQTLLFELILAANYMDIKPLLDLTCATAASMIKEKTPEEIRSTFNITNDFSPEEEAQVREENKWCEEV